MPLATIAMFWDGPPLGFVERLCITSFRDAGHPVVVFSYGDIQGLPDGIQTASATDILPNPTTMLRHERTGSPAPYADKFRYHLLAKNDGLIWADTDAYCLKPFEPKNGYFFGRENDHIVANGVMALPAASSTLTDLTAFCEDEYAIPQWVRPAQMAEIKKRAAEGNPMHISEMPWGSWGPSAFSYFLRKNDEFRFSLDPHVLYPVSFRERGLYFRLARRTWSLVQDDTVSIHFYGRRVRSILKNKYGGIPPENSVLAELAEKHKVAI